MENQLTRFSATETHLLPDQPGVYRYFNKEEELIYVGKAKSLKKRISSYFLNKTLDRKTRKLVSEILNIEITLTNSEFDALLLENNLIKNHQPRYNILLRDDKTFPHIHIPKEAFPRIFSTRTLDKDKGEYFGPYASVKAMKSVIDLLRKLYTIRTCSYDLSQQNIKKKKFKICMEYHIGNCKGPCEDRQSEADYANDIEQSRNILKGKLGPVRLRLKQQMQSAVEILNFENAQKFKERLELLDKFQSNSQVSNSDLGDIDVIAMVTDDNRAFINYMKLIEGMVVSTETIEVKRLVEEPDEEILGQVLIDMRLRYNSEAKDVLTNIEIDFDDEKLKIFQPKIGDKKKLVDLSLRNALYFKKERLENFADPKARSNRLLAVVQKDLRLNHLPDHIECFDNSNIQGTNPVASMVCFKDAKASKKDYRHYNIKTVVGPDDFSSMKEIVSRRYKRVLAEGLDLPKLIIIDGGKGQLGMACESLKELGLYGKIPIIGIAKRLEELYYPEDSFPLHLGKKSETLKLLQQIRDEAHRFAITFHRLKRSNAALKSELEDIKGLGPKTIELLFTQFKTLDKIKSASLEELDPLIGKAKAELLMAYFQA